jgi:hypothetical protein
MLSKRIFLLLVAVFFLQFLFAPSTHAATLLSNISESNNAGTSIFRSNIWIAYKFTAGAGAIISSVTLDLDHTAGNYTGFSTYTSGVMRFYNDNSGVVGSQLTGTLTYTSTNTGNGVTVYGTASGGTITIPSSGTYWIAFTCASCANVDYQETTSSGYTGSSDWQTVISSSAVSSSNNSGSTWGTPYSTATYGTAMLTIEGTLTGDITAPTITNVSSDKANGSYTVGEVIDIDVTFSEAVTSTGDVTVTLETGDTDRTCTFTVSSSTTGTCNYTVQAGDTSLDLTVSSISGTIKDAALNAMSNFVPTTNLADNKALVIDTTAPTISTLSPADNATSVSATTDLVMTFDSAVDVETGNIVIYKSSDDSVIETIDVTSGQVTGTGTTTITINPSVTLSSGTEYYVQVATTAFDDVVGNSYAGITDTTSWSFTTADTDSPAISSIATSVSDSSVVVTWTTDEESSSLVEYGTTNSYGSTTTETDTAPRVTSHSVTLSGLNNCTTYHFRVKSNDASSNEGVSSNGTFSTVSCGSVPVFFLFPIQQPTINQNILTSKTSDDNNTEKQNTHQNFIESNFKFNKNLKQSEVNNDIKELQTFLKNQGKNIYPEGLVTGYFGPLTKRAVIRFQEKYFDEILAPLGNKKGTGFVGEYTRIKINKILNASN